MGAIDHTHAACSDLFNDEIVAERLANHRRKTRPLACLLGRATGKSTRDEHAR
jgi:hypothetical protein